MKKKIFLTAGLCVLAVVIAAGVTMAVGDSASSDSSVNTDDLYSADAVIPDAVSIEGTDVSGMTASQAQAVVDAYLDQFDSSKITLTAGDKSLTAGAGDLGLTARNDVVKEALAYGKSGNLLERYKASEAISNGEKKDFSISLTVDAATAKRYLADHDSELSTAAVDNKVVLNNGSFDYVAGSSGVSIDADASSAKIADFVSSDWDGGDGTVALKTDTVDPKGTKKQLSTIKDVLGSYSTDFSTSTAARATNVKNAASKIDGTILYPGETFSVAAALNPMTAENGYEPAPSYENGTTVETYGGGICQASTTLYNAVIRAELEVVTRSAHSMIVHYVEPSMDAAIAGTSKDFQFKNNQKTPVYIQGYTENGQIYFNIYGKETRPANRTVSFESEIISQTDPITIYQANASLPIGTVTKTSGEAHTGYKARLWKIVTVDGVEQSREVFNNSTYKATNNVYAVGIASANANASAAVNAAIATQDKATIDAAIAQWNDAALAAQQAAAAQTTDAAPDAQSGGTDATQQQTAAADSSGTAGTDAGQ